MFTPAYNKLCENGELHERVEQANKILESCRLCPHQCGVNRIEGELGVCKTGDEAIISSYGPHFGEEPPLVGLYGSGTIFFTSCNLKCVFCQNFEISHLVQGKPLSVERMADIMLRLQLMGCHNINFVTPTHCIPQILAATDIASQKGLKIPLVYNCGGYESVDILKLLDGVFDIYMPDIKYTDKEVSELLSNVKDYPSIVKLALKEMYHQVGDLILDENGIALRGMIVRHLVLPNNLAGTREAMRFIAREISQNTYVNIMAQYRPCHEADKYPEINRRPTVTEYRDAIQMAKNVGLTRLA